MPIPEVKSGQAITPANFQAPFESNFTRFGVKGLNISDAIDAIGADELTRMLNVTHRQDYGVTSRSGLLALNSVAGRHHSIRRLNDPSDSTYTRYEGVGTTLQRGTSSLSAVASGFSGSPLTMLPYRPPLSGQPWMYVADTDKMVKVSIDGTVLPIGLPAPSVIATTALATENKTTIAAFDASDGTAAANWTGNKGYVYSDPPVFIDGTELLAITDDEGAPAVHFGALETTPVLPGYYAYYGCPKTMDLSKVGAITATDDDYIHIRVNFSHTQFIKEFRVYLVCSTAFSSSVLPGASDSAGANADAYLKSFSASDFAGYIQAQLTQIDAAELSRIRDLRDQNLTQATPRLEDARKRMLGQIPASPVGTTVANTEVDRTITEQSNAASDQWQSFGIVSIPLRRGDWQRIGTTAGRDWSTITGIMTYIQTGPSGKYPVGTVAARMSQFYLTGGSGPDSGEPDASPYDYKYTNYDPRTGAEGNPSTVQLAVNYLDALRRSINVTPAAYGDAAVRQRFYRKGGTLPTDWFFVGVNTADGGVFVDGESDLSASTAGSVEDDNFQPVPTVNAAGLTILNQPLSSLWGPLQDLVFGCGDPYRPGTVYFCKPGNPDSWPDENRSEVCSPSEQVLGGVLWGGQAFACSTEHWFVLYPNFSGEIPTVTSTVTQCTRGAVNRWAFAAGMGGIYFIHPDGIYRTAGGPEDWLSKNIDPLFNGKSANGMLPIDFSETEYLRLSIFQNELYFQYKDTDGVVQCLVYSIPYQFWRQYTFAQPTACFYTDEGAADDVMLVGGDTSGYTYTFSGTNDDSHAIACLVRTGAMDFNKPRLEKRLGDQSLDCDTQGVDLILQNLLDYEAVTNPAQTIDVAAGRYRVILDSFGPNPQRALNVSTQISWTSNTFQPVIYNLGTTIVFEPDMTINRVTQWDDLGSPNPIYLEGLTLDCDTGGEDKTVIVEYDYNGATLTAATLTINCNGRHKISKSWPAVRANKVRLRPDDEACTGWILYKADWMFLAEPPAIANWDSYFENKWDQYYTGLDLFCDTFGLDKTVDVYVDGVLVKTETVNTAGRLVWHITLPWGRGHVFRFVATDANPGTLYDYRWQLEPEPSEQTNWNQNFTVAGSLADKYLKAVLFECDTFGEDKDVTVECDGVVVETLTVNTNGRKVVQFSFPQQLGRVFRIYPTDDNPGRLYSMQWVFDQLPFELDRWETQPTTHGFMGWSYATHAHIMVRSTADVTFTITAYNQSGASTQKSYLIPSTAGQRIKVFVPLQAIKGILHEYLLTAASPFMLFRDESVVYVREWNTNATAEVHIFGNDDLDSTRPMANAALAAARPGGTLA